MNDANHLEAWLTTAEVCARLGISESTLKREAAAGKWQARKRPRPGKKPETVYPPHEVAARGVTADLRAQGVSFSVSVQIDPSQMKDWEPERITALFNSIATVLAARFGVKP
jgi:hypothetical protein